MTLGLDPLGVLPLGTATTAAASSFPTPTVQFFVNLEGVVRDPVIPPPGPPLAAAITLEINDLNI